MTTPQAWIEIIVPASAAEVDEIAALLADRVEAAAAGTEIRGDEVVFWTALDRGEDVAAATRSVVADLAAAGAGVDPARVRTQVAVPEEEWRDAWKRSFHVTPVGRRTVIVPSWERYEPASGERRDVEIHLDPGMAFGTGTHASTRLVLEELERLADEGGAPGRVLDVGSGSGILAIAASRLWPQATVLAIDNDPVAVRACAENCAVNGVDARVASEVTPVDEVTEAFGLVLANIQAHVLLGMRAALYARCAPGATLILSGLMATQADGVAADFVATGLTLLRVRTSTDDALWATVVLRRA